MGRLEGKSVLVTAAGQGIGRASSIAMAKEGAKVFATDINMQTLRTLNDDGHPNIVTFKLNVLDDDSVANGVSRANPDIIFNCAGFVQWNSFRGYSRGLGFRVRFKCKIDVQNNSTCFA